MKKLINRIKYFILNELLNEICIKSELNCEGCVCKCQVELEGFEDMAFHGCEQQDVLFQARKVWKLGNYEDST